MLEREPLADWRFGALATRTNRRVPRASVPAIICPQSDRDRCLGCTRGFVRSRLPSGTRGHRGALANSVSTSGHRATRDLALEAAQLDRTQKLRSKLTEVREDARVVAVGLAMALTDQAKLSRVPVRQRTVSHREPRCGQSSIICSRAALQLRMHVS